MQMKKLSQSAERWALRHRWVYRLSAAYYRPIIRREIALANITAHDHVLFIGGGFCPFSAILLRELTGATITVIDCDPTCVSAACGFVGKDISVQRCNGMDAPLLGYTVVHVAMQVSPMQDVFAAARARAAGGTRLLLRVPKKTVSRAYDPLTNQFLGCTTVAHNQFCSVHHTVLYIKED